MCVETIIKYYVYTHIYTSLFLNMCNIDPIQFLTSNTLNLNVLFIQRCQNDYFIIFL